MEKGDEARNGREIGVGGKGTDKNVGIWRREIKPRQRQ